MTLTEWLFVMAPVWGLSALTVGHVLLCQFYRPHAGLKPLVVAIGAGLLVTAAVTACCGQGRIEPVADWWGAQALHALTYIGLAYGYANFYNLGIASLRIRILQELLATPAGMTRDNLLDRYNGRRIVETRLQRLVESRQLDSRDDRLYTRMSSLILLAYLFLGFKRLILRRGFRHADR